MLPPKLAYEVCELAVDAMRTVVRYSTPIAEPTPAFLFVPREPLIAGVDALVIGRKTFEKVLTFDNWPYGNKPVVVLSSRPADLVAPANAVCEMMAGTPSEVVARLAERGMKHLYIDGGVTIQRFLEAGLIQRVIITRIPVLLGSGIPLFGSLSRDIRLEHVATRSYPSGLVQTEYAIRPQSLEAPSS